MSTREVGIVEYLRYKANGFLFKKQDLPDSTPVGLDREVAAASMLAALGEETDAILGKAQKERKVLELVSVDDEVGQALETRKEAVVATSYRLEPGEGPVFEYLTEYLKQNIEINIRGAFSAIPFGYSVMELMWEIQEGDLTLVDIVQKPFYWFNVGQDGRLYWNKDGEDIDLFDKYPGKFILARREPSYQHPAGRPLLSLLYWPWFFKSQGVELWAIALERYGQPLLIGTKKMIKKEGDLERFANELRKAARGGALALEEGDTAAALGGANWKGPHDVYIKYFDRQIQKVILGQNLTSEVSGGSLAASKTHNLVRIDKRNADLRLVQGVIQEILDIICHFRFPGQEVPQFIFDDGVGLQAERSTRDKDLAPVLKESGLRFTPEYFKDSYELGEEHVEEAPISVTPPIKEQKTSFSLPPFPKGESAVHQMGGVLHGECIAPAHIHRRFTSKLAESDHHLLSDTSKLPLGQKAIENLVDNAVKTSPEPIPPDAILAVIDKSKNPKELEKNLMALLGDDVLLNDFREHMARALYLADGWGYASSTEDKKK